MNPVSTGRCIGEAQELSKTGRACQPQRSRRRQGRVQKSRDNASGAGDTRVSSNAGYIASAMSTLTGEGGGGEAWGVVEIGLVSTFEAVPGATGRGSPPQSSLFLPFCLCLIVPNTLALDFP